jgi:hypothetical protein
MAPNSKKRTMEASSDSNIAEVVPESDAANSQPHDPKKCWVWQYFKTETSGNKSYNIFQESHVPGGSVLCLKQLAVNKKSSTKRMSNHLNSCYGLKSDAQSKKIGAITDPCYSLFLKNNSISFDDVNEGTTSDHL